MPRKLHKPEPRVEPVARPLLDALRHGCLDAWVLEATAVLRLQATSLKRTGMTSSGAADFAARLREALFRARNGMTTLAWTPVLPEGRPPPNCDVHDVFSNVR